MKIYLPGEVTLLLAVANTQLIGKRVTEIIWGVQRLTRMNSDTSKNLKYKEKTVPRNTEIYSYLQ